MPIFAIFGHFLAIFGRFGPFLDREHQKQCNCNLLGATGPTNYINMVSNGYLEIWSVSDPKTNSGAKQDPKLTWGGQNWSFCTLCSPTNLFYTKNVNSEMVTSKSYFLAWNRPGVSKKTIFSSILHLSRRGKPSLKGKRWLMVARIKEKMVAGCRCPE